MADAPEPSRREHSRGAPQRDDHTVQLRTCVRTGNGGRKARDRGEVGRFPQFVATGPLSHRHDPTASPESAGTIHGSAPRLHRGALVLPLPDWAVRQGIASSF